VANPERKLRCLYRLVEDGMTEMEIGQPNDNPVQAIDDFVDETDLAKVGFGDIFSRLRGSLHAFIGARALNPSALRPLAPERPDRSERRSALAGGARPMQSL
jgi:2-keto-3-deoxy-6-phosphogluconate aldolase